MSTAIRRSLLPVMLFLMGGTVRAASPVLNFTTTLGAQGYEAAYGIAVDAAGYIYVAGETDSLGFSSSGRRSSRDAFVAKLDPSGSTIVYLTYFGGSGTDGARAIAVDSAGSAYVAGVTNSPDFPITSGAAGGRNAGLEDAFIVKLDPSGAVLYSTMLGSAGSDQAAAIAVDALGNAYIAGQTNGSFPTTSGALQTHFRGGTDCFVAKLSANGGTLLYSTLLGGSGIDSCRGIAVDSAGNAYVTGVTYSSDFPLQSALQTALKGSANAFVAKLNASGSALIYSTFFGGGSFDEANAIALDWSGAAYIAGDTTSWNFPTTPGAPQTLLKGDYDAFVVKLSPAGDAAVYSTLVGGSNRDAANAIAVDAYGRAVISGMTASVDLPQQQPVQASAGGSMDAFTAVVDSSGSSLILSSYLGGSGDDRALAVATAPGNRIYLAGFTQSPDFPSARAGAVTAGNADVFVTEIWFPAQVLTVTVAPPAATLSAGQTIQFTAAIANAANPGVVWSVSPAVGSITPDGWYTAPSTVTVATAVTVTATSVVDRTTQGTALVSLVITPPGPTARFVKLDTATQGSWKSVYGADGFNVINNAVVNPVFVTAAPSGNLSYTWAASTTDPRGLQQVAQSQRVAGVWYTSGSFSVDLPAHSAQTYQLAVYCLDWDNIGRVETLDILDASGNVLDSRTISNFSGGVWAVWTVSGHVQLRVTRVSGLNAVMSGLFFSAVGPKEVAVAMAPQSAVLSAGQTQQFTAMVMNSTNTVVNWSISPGAGSIDATGLYTAPATIPSQQPAMVTATSQADGRAWATATITLLGAATAQFAKVDTTTQGAWKGVYGTEGYNLISHAVNYPAYVTPTPAGSSNYLWSATTTDPRALQQVNATWLRVAGVWYAHDSFTVDLPFSGTQLHQLAVYCLDWDSLGRSQALDILDANNNVLDSRSVSGFRNGVWLVWNVGGHVQLRVTRTGPTNAVISGIFFSPGGSAHFAQLDTATQGTWQGIYGGDGYNVIGNAVAYPASVAPSPSGNLAYTWAAGTQDSRALQQTAAPGQRIAGVWYSSSQFVIDLPFSDAQLHELAVYCLDWDNIQRSETLEILDANNNVLDSRSLSSFAAGVWAVWNVSGHVQLRVRRTAGVNAVISGLFFASGLR